MGIVRDKVQIDWSLGPYSYKNMLDIVQSLKH